MAMAQFKTCRVLIGALVCILVSGGSVLASIVQQAGSGKCFWRSTNGSSIFAITVHAFQELLNTRILLQVISTRQAAR
jgi:hypothetical protein